MGKKNRLRSTLLTFLLLLGFNQAHAQENDDLNTKIIIFTDELEEFLDHSWMIYNEGPDLEPAKLEKEIKLLMENANRIAAAYFEALDTEVQPEMETYLHQTYIQNAPIHHYFLLLGNALFGRANNLVENQKDSNKKLRTRSTIGGTILGLATGGAVLYFKRNLFGNALYASLFVIGLGAAGAGLGYGGAYLTHTFILPANPVIDNAKEFLARYPTGEDFVDDIADASSDISLGLLELEEAMSDVGIN